MPKKSSNQPAQNNAEQEFRLNIRPLARSFVAQLYQSKKEADEKGVEFKVNTDEIFQKLHQNLLQEILQAEMEAHLGTSKYEHVSKNTSVEDSSSLKGLVGEEEKAERNYRNGSYKRTLRSNNGDISIDMPRDRLSTFNSFVAPKGQKNLTDISEKILYLASNGNSSRSIASEIKELIGLQVSHEYVSSVIENYQERLVQWKNRTLRPFYPFLFIDCLYVPVRFDDGKVDQRAVYVVLGIDMSGHKELLDFHIGTGSEGKTEWLNVFAELKDRGLEDVLFVSMDGVSGLEDGLKIIYPNAIIQRCMVHLMRNSMQFVVKKDRYEFAKDAKKIYSAHNYDESKQALEDLEKKWPKLTNATKIWRRHFDSHIAPLFNYPSSIRKIIYTTNAIESVNSSLRTVVKKGCYNSKESIMSMMLLRADKVLSTNWNRRAVHNWPNVISVLLNHEKTAPIVEKYFSTN